MVDAGYQATLDTHQRVKSKRRDQPATKASSCFDAFSEVTGNAFIRHSFVMTYQRRSVVVGICYLFDQATGKLQNLRLELGSFGKTVAGVAACPRLPFLSGQAFWTGFSDGKRSAVFMVARKRRRQLVTIASHFKSTLVF